MGKSKVETLLGMKIANQRKNSGLTQDGLAEKIQVASETISRLERGVTIPSVKTLALIAEALNVEVRDFFDFQHLQSNRDEALDKLFIELKARKREEIEHIHDLLKSTFRYVDKMQ